MTGYLVGGLAGCVSGAVDLFLPKVCGACVGAQVAAGGLCERCSAEMLCLVALPYCPRCGATIGPNIPARMDGCAICPSTLPRFARVIRLGPYAGPLRSVVGELKYRRGGVMHRRLGGLLAEAIAGRCEEDSFDLAVPVAMHWRRRLARGCNHARILTGTLAGKLNLPLGDELVRIRHTPPQTHLTRSQRLTNVRGAFGVTAPAAVAGARVLLVDDVTTTGATANEAARTLLAAGASSVTLAVVAKSEPPTAYQQHWQ